jgi:hypothetical protein
MRCKTLLAAAALAVLVNAGASAFTPVGTIWIPALFFLFLLDFQNR